MIFIVVTSSCVFAHSFWALSFRLGFFLLTASSSFSRLPFRMDSRVLALESGAVVCEDEVSLLGVVVDEVEGVVGVEVMVDNSGTAQVNGSAWICAKLGHACCCCPWID
jgi:hypothetical protein